MQNNQDHTLHCHLRKTFRWYDKWHSHPRHSHAHWLFFVSVLFLSLSFVSGVIFTTYNQLEINSIAQAQASPQSCEQDRINDARTNGIIIGCYISPFSVSAGEAVLVSGYNLDLAGNFTIDLESSGPDYSVTSTADSNGLLISFIVPAYAVDGTYSITLRSSRNDPNFGYIEELIVIAQKITVSGQPDDGFDPDYDQPPEGDPFKQVIETVNPPPATNFQDLINNLFTTSIYVVGIAVFIMMLWAGFLWLTSAANPGHIARAKSMMLNAILGAILLLSSYVILYTINPDLVGGQPFILDKLKFQPLVNNQAVVRVVAMDEVGAASAITAGCNVALELREVTAIECPSGSVEALGLPLDPVIEIQDIDANQQVNVTVIQSSGNIGAGRRIVILDTGYNRTHPELTSSYGGGWDFVNKDNDPTDDHTSGTGSPGHGSHVAGIITADGNDARAKGVAPGVQIIAGKILNSEGKGYWSTMIDAIYWAVNGPDGDYGTADDFKPDVINISMGGGSYRGICDDNDETSKLLLKAIRYARDSGVLPVIAAGNIPSGISMPGCISEAFTVGAVDSSYNLANFSGRGQAIDLVAPGVNIYSTLLGTSYGTKSGTSMAAPIVSGIVALIKNTHPEYSVADLEKTLAVTAIDLGGSGKDSTYGWGSVTVNGAVPAGQPIPPPPPLPTPPPSQPPPYTIPITRCSGNVCGRIWNNFPSCTKNTLPSNLNCNMNIGYQAYNLSLPESLSIRVNNVEIQKVNCTSTTCGGYISYPDPKSGPHSLTVHTSSNGNQLALVSSYVYTRGTLTASYASCAKNSSTSNRYCDLTLTTNAPSVYPSQVLIKKDGYNWQLITCRSSACAETIVDRNPSLGIHTYTLHNASDGSRLFRVTTSVSVAAVPPPPASVCGNGRIDPGEQCDGTNLGGATCQSIGSTGTGSLVCDSNCTYGYWSCNGTAPTPTPVPSSAPLPPPPPAPGGCSISITNTASTYANRRCTDYNVTAGYYVSSVDVSWTASGAAQGDGYVTLCVLDPTGAGTNCQVQQYFNGAPSGGSFTVDCKNTSCTYGMDLTVNALKTVSLSATSTSRFSPGP